MHLRRMCGRPLVHGTWGWIAGWLEDVWLDLRNRRVAAFEIFEAHQLERVRIAPIAVSPSVRFGIAIEADFDRWQIVHREPEWVAFSKLDEVIVTSSNGERSCTLVDIEADPETWQLTRFRVRRPW